MPIGTRHDPTKVMMGASLSTTTASSVESLPGNIAAGLAFRRNTSTGEYQTAASGASPLLGISMGRSLGKNGCFSGCYGSPAVALRLTEAFEPTVGAQVHIDNTTGMGKASDGGTTATAAVYEKVLLGGGIDEVTGAAINIAIINMTAGL